MTNNVKNSVIVIGVGLIFCIFCYLMVMYNNRVNKSNEVEQVTVESLIKSDQKSMDSIYKGNIFWESRIVLKSPFNVSDSLDVDEVTNVFQTNIKKGYDIYTTVYMFIHNMNTGESNLEVHKNAWISDDIELDMDSIKVDFNQAFKNARQSNFVPSKSRYITLRHGFGRYLCNPFYSIGNQNDGHLWVDAITGEVFDKDPAGAGF